MRAHALSWIKLCFVQWTMDIGWQLVLTPSHSMAHSTVLRCIDGLDRSHCWIWSTCFHIAANQPAKQCPGLDHSYHWYWAPFKGELECMHSFIWYTMYQYLIIYWSLCWPWMAHMLHNMTHIYSLNLKNKIGLCELPRYNITALVSTHLIYIFNIILKLLYIKV